METTNEYKLSAGQKFYRVIKAGMDFVIALLAVIVLSPIFLIVAIAIKIDSKGPVFFVQKRVGKNGKLFNCIKFRSMSVEARHDVASYEYADVQSYVTKVGKFIRKCSIDELPQFFNMLAGQMSLIGYRPSQPNEDELNEARESYSVHQVRPGISGWAQVNGRDVLAANPKKKATFDAYYVRHFSFWLDVKIFFMTIVAVFKKEGIVEGVVESTEEQDIQEQQEIEENTSVEQNEAEEEVAATDSATINILDGVEDVVQEEVV